MSVTLKLPFTIHSENVFLTTKPAYVELTSDGTLALAAYVKLTAVAPRQVRERFGNTVVDQQK